MLHTTPNVSKEDLGIIQEWRDAKKAFDLNYKAMIQDIDSINLVEAKKIVERFYKADKAYNKVIQFYES